MKTDYTDLVGEQRHHPQTLHTLVSSANIATLLLRIESGRLFTYNKKRAGPSIDPCGTPEVIGRSRDVAPSTVTRWRLPQRNLSPVYTNRFYFGLHNYIYIYIYIFFFLP